MDHLPLPENGVALHIRVPLLGDVGHLSDTYDEDAHVAYPESLGYKMYQESDTQLRYLALNQFTDDISLHGDKDAWLCIATMLQSWLYFGLLRLVFEEEFRIDDFVVVDRPGLLTSNKLRDLLRSRGEGWKEQKALNRIFCLIDHAWEQVVFLETWVEDPCIRDYPLPEILLSVRILAQTLEHSAMKRVFPGEKPWRGRSVTVSGMMLDARRGEPRLVQSDTPSSPSRLPILRMLTPEKGWCPVRARQLSELFSPSSFYYLACFPRQTRVDHSICGSGDALSCVAYNTDADFEARHVEAECACAPARVSNTEEMYNILRNGGVPIVTASITRTGQMQLRYVKATTATPYIAISHLWSDGLGDQSHNYLPSCQVNLLLQRMHNLLRCWRSGGQLAKRPSNGNITERVLRKPVSFWLDVYCVPIAGIDEATDNLKQHAIARMRRTYSLASHVLILDNDIQIVDASDPSSMDGVASIYVSAWRTRYWTHQELTLAQAAFVQTIQGPALWPNRYHVLQRRHFAHLQRLESKQRFYTSEEIFSANESQEAVYRNRAIQNMRFRDIHATRIPTVQTGNADICEHFRCVWNDLVDKTSSKSDDMHFIMASLLDLSPSEILKLPTEWRMKAILASFDTLPLGLLFDGWSSHDRCADSSTIDLGDQWIPKYPNVKGRLLPPNGQLHVTPDGLRIENESFTDGHLRALVVRLDDNTNPSELIKFRTLISASTGPNNQLQQTSYRIKLGRQSILKSKNVSCSLAQILLLLEKVGTAAHRGRGAYFFVRRSDNTTIFTDYGGPLLYLEGEEGEDVEPGDSTGYVPAAPVEEDYSLKDRHVLLQCNIAHWPRLRHITRTSDRALSRWTYDIATLSSGLSCCLFWVILLVAFMLAAFLRGGGFTYLCVPLPIMAQIWIVEIVNTANYYLRLETFVTDSDESLEPWWQRLQTTMPAPRAIIRLDGFGRSRTWHILFLYGLTFPLVTEHKVRRWMTRPKSEAGSNVELAAIIA